MTVQVEDASRDLNQQPTADQRQVSAWRGFRLTRTSVMTLLIAAMSTGPTLAQWIIPIEQNAMLATCAGVNNIPVAGATDCPTAITSAQNLFTAESNIPGCVTACPAGQTIQMQAPTCVPDPYVRPNGSQAIRWQVGLMWTCVASTGTGDGILKVCKVAGTGITVGSPFNFTVSTSASHGVLTIPAGPAPGGTCKVGPGYPVGTQVAVTETIPAGDTVSSITVAPSSQLVSTNLPGGGVTVTIGSGVTEATFTDNRTGFLEICKSGEVTGNFSFTVNPGNLGPFAVPAGACSPAIEVAAGSVTIHELTTGTNIVACNTIPASQQGSCNVPPGSQSSVVTVAPGDISTMTIAFITNQRIGPPTPVPPPPAR
jgi:hypothetical protein